MIDDGEPAAALMRAYNSPNTGDCVSMSCQGTGICAPTRLHAMFVHQKSLGTAPGMYDIKLTEFLWSFLIVCNYLQKNLGSLP